MYASHLPFVHCEAFREDSTSTIGRKHTMVFVPYDQRTKDSDRFAMLPMVLLEDPVYRNKIDMAAVVAYSLLRNRQSLSIDTGWIDEEGNVYCYYSRENLAETMNISLRSVDKIFKQLKDAELIKSVRQGLNKPNKLYVGLPTSSGPANIAHPDMQNLRTINKEVKNKEYLNNNPDEKIRVMFFLSESNSIFVSVYGDIYEQFSGRLHPRINEEQMKKVEERVSEVINDRYVDPTEYERIIRDYFMEYVIGRENDGNINAFIKRFESLVC